jgi:cytochrome c biogenesis protein CcmG/thiol:disulfide interchange protein DsbE
VIRVALVALPLVVLAALVAVFAFSIDRDPGLVRSVLIGKPVPQFTLPPVEGLGVPGFATADLQGEPTLVNVFASWCVPCRAEHPLLEALKAQTGIRLYGINQADAPENARAFLAELGNPYDAVGADRDRRVSIDWGVYGVPETFVVDADGVITYKHVGPMTPQTIEREVLPAIEAAGG